MKRIGNVSFQENGAAYIQNLISEAVENGSRTCTVSGNWEIEETVRIPSDFTLVLDGCHLRMQDGAILNFFTNEHAGSKDPMAKDYDIIIEGRGRAILDGGEPNGLHERVIKNTPELYPGITHCGVNSPILFDHVDGLRISGLHIRNQRYWGVVFVFCCHGVVRDIEFRSNDIMIDENGQRVHGLSLKYYENILVKNSDGIDLRTGCHDFIIENITGFTEDDTVALTALWHGIEKAYYAEGDCLDIRNVIIRNINSAALCSNVRLLCGDGVKLHDVLIDGVFDASRECRFMNAGVNTVKLGDTHNYSTSLAKYGDMFNIAVRNIHCAGNSKRSKPVNILSDIVNLTVENIYHTPEVQL